MILNFCKQFSRLYICFFLIQLLILNSCQQDTSAGNGLLISGPMLGYSEHRSVLIWLEVSKEVHEVEIKYSENKLPPYQTKKYNGQLGEEFNPLRIEIGGLKMNTIYKYEIYLNGEKSETKYPLMFRTKELWEWRNPPPDFSFLLGSCAYINDAEYDRPGEPFGQDVKIFDAMKNKDSDFMIWLGDNIYLREADWSSSAGIVYRYNQVRSQPYLQDFLASRPHYAIWDDHDYGPNDANSSYELKDISLKWFKKYWGNQTYGEEHGPRHG